MVGERRSRWLMVGWSTGYADGRDFAPRTQRRCGMVDNRMVRGPPTIGAKILPLTRSRHLIDGSLSLDGFRSGWIAAMAALANGRHSQRCLWLS